MATEMKSQLPAIRERMRRARTAGLIAAADVFLEAMRRAVRGGYTSGEFVTGQIQESIQRGEPDADAKTIYVGTKWHYALQWELGHMNAFTRQFERREIWMPTFLSQRDAIRNAYALAFRRAWEISA